MASLISSDPTHAFKNNNSKKTKTNHNNHPIRAGAKLTFSGDLSGKSADCFPPPNP